MEPRLLPEHPVASLDEYVEGGGGEALRRARAERPEAVIEELAQSGVRGRGGAGFPTATKWRSILTGGGGKHYAVCNAAEGEPGTFKDRALLRANPYSVLEGLLVAARTVGAAEAFIALKAGFEAEIHRVTSALAEMAEAGWVAEAPVTVVAGPDEYLFGEEKALLEVIEGNDPLPRIVPPWMEGLFRTPGSPNPTGVNNVETLANVPHILREGADWFRSLGTDDSREPCCSRCAVTSAIPACTSCPWGSRSESSSTAWGEARPRAGS